MPSKFYSKKDIEQIFNCSWNTIIKRYGSKLPKSHNEIHPELYAPNSKKVWKDKVIEAFIAKL